MILAAGKYRINPDCVNDRTVIAAYLKPSGEVYVLRSSVNINCGKEYSFENIDGTSDPIGRGGHSIESCLNDLFSLTDIINVVNVHFFESPEYFYSWLCLTLYNGSDSEEEK
ncbi:MAG: hypothetical protein GY861_21995 [bacterium]|nr:hypothetical protein [bacterium]